MHIHKKTIITVIAVGVVAGAVGFYGGTLLAGSATPTRGGNTGNFGGRNGTSARGAFTSGGFLGGEVLSKDDKSLTLKLRDGSSRIVFLSGSTLVMRAATGTIADVGTGSQVTVTGTDNSDGSVTAQTIQIRPAGVILRQNQGGSKAESF